MWPLDNGWSLESSSGPQKTESHCHWFCWTLLGGDYGLTGLFENSIQLVRIDRYYRVLQLFFV